MMKMGVDLVPVGLPDVAAKLETVQVGHHQVHKDSVELFLLHQAGRLATVAHGKNFQAHGSKKLVQ